MKPTDPFFSLKQSLDGDVYTDQVQKVIYATDASSYREIPAAVTRPKNKEDIRKIIDFAQHTGNSVIPRAGGTSLAGQVVGSGIVVDISKYLNKTGELNIDERWIEVEPGVVLAELNQFLSKHELQFAPETSTANRCCIGGMLGNNSCGLHSLIHGSTREHVLEVEGILADGSEVKFKALTTEEFETKCAGNPEILETKIYKNIKKTLADQFNQQEIRNEYPDPKVTRRNNGYALDVLLETDPFTQNGKPFNFCKLLAGSEGTLMFATKIKLNLVPLPPKFQGLVCAHFNTLEDAFYGNIIALRHKPDAIELTDHIILNCTLENIEQRKNRFFIEGNPKAILTIEFSAETETEIQEKAAKLEEDLRKEGYGYHFPLFTDKESIRKIWELRKAGLGLLSNIPGDKRNVTVIEDTAVAPDYLPDYIREFDQIIAKYQLTCVYYGHIATGELHLRPLLNLKDPEDVRIYHLLAREVAQLVKKFRGSLSGEHGDGRLRGEFIPLMLGDHNYELIRKLKHTWDPQNIMNPGKIVDTPIITKDLRLLMGQSSFQANTLFDYAPHGDLLRSVEMCNGSGDCRKSNLIGGTMCPSYMATRDEDKSTRARANVLREYLTRPQKANIFDSKEVLQVLDLCLSCKACKSECPSNVDMAKFKAEFLQQYYQKHGFPMRSLLIAYLPRINSLGMFFRPVTNLITSTNLFKKMIGFAPERKIPELAAQTLRNWSRNQPMLQEKKSGKVYLFADEFTNFNESHIGIKAILLLNKLGYEVVIPKHKESGRTYLSKGLVRKAKQIATFNVGQLSGIISEETPLIGIEPSTILTFRDEYPELVEKPLQEKARNLAKNALMLEEFMVQEIEKGNIRSEQFCSDERTIRLHGHCQQKAVASTLATRKMLELPANYSVQEIRSGCCGMAGSFGYEKEHYELSMQIGELDLFPAVRKATSEEIIAAPGTSCRHHIEDGTGRKALHPVEVMWEAVKK
ncbi:MAG TPA: FAD-linked oxidase C-terminal domain-containing protein [Prolixibacteraceae bacterium]|nr:FAD-linked oxidase C-terminal domain-containing protein [Prolixibacteraceae bacterium]